MRKPRKHTDPAFQRLVACLYKDGKGKSIWAIRAETGSSQECIELALKAQGITIVKRKYKNFEGTEQQRRRKRETFRKMKPARTWPCKYIDGHGKTCGKHSANRFYCPYHHEIVSGHYTGLHSLIDGAPA